jgi:NAD(P)-dependent dehydrogenase (short-subunit alcohol dehydrogenase family)
MAGLLEGKAALITGGARGIGRAAAQAFAREGARLVVSDLLAEGAQETVAMINACGGQAVSVSGDVTKPEMVKAWVDTVVKTYGRIDCAFNNAGIAGNAVGANSGLAGAGVRSHDRDQSQERVALHARGDQRHAR